METTPRPTTGAGLTWQDQPFDVDTAQFELAVDFAERDGSLTAVINYNTGLFDEATVRGLGAHLATVVGEMAGPDKPLADVRMLTPEEEHTLTHGWNDTAQDIPEPLLPELFAAQAARTPDAVALVHGEERLTFAELDRAAARLRPTACASGVPDPTPSSASAPTAAPTWSSPCSASSGPVPPACPSTPATRPTGYATCWPTRARRPSSYRTTWPTGSPTTRASC